MKIPQDILNAWLNSMRAERWPQTHGMYYSDSEGLILIIQDGIKADGPCCALGALCRIACQDFKLKKYKPHELLGDTTFNSNVFLTDKEMQAIVDMNDNQKLPFPVIADAIATWTNEI